MNKYREFLRNETYNGEFEIWESGVITTLQSLPREILQDLTRSKELGYYAGLVLKNTQNLDVKSTMYVKISD